MIQFAVLSEKLVKSSVESVGSYYRIVVRDIKTKALFTVKNGESVVGRYSGGFCESILKKGEVIEIDGDKITMNRDTGVDATFSNSAALKAASEFESLVVIG
jgi:phage gp45-like